MDYKQAGVDIEAGNEVVRRIRTLARGTLTPGVLSDIGSFGGLFRLERGRCLGPGARRERRRRRAPSCASPSWRACTTPSAPTWSITASTTSWCRGREPLFFLDYLATGRLEPDVAVQVVEGLAARAARTGVRCSAARRPRCRGSTPTASTMSPGSSSASSSESRLVDGRAIAPGDVLIGLPSSGLHTNGYSLARRIVFDAAGLSIDVARAGAWRSTVGEALLAPHRSYLPVLRPLLGARLDQGDGAHHRRGHHGQSAREFSRPPRVRGLTSARGHRRDCSSFCARPARCPKTTCCGHSTWGSGW